MVQVHRKTGRPGVPAAGPVCPWRGRRSVAGRSLAARAAVPAAALALAACEGPQSALDPAGRDAETIFGLTAWMVAGAAVVWVLVIGIAVYAIAVGPGRHSERRANALVIGGGVAFPTVVLTVLLVYGLSLMPELDPPAPADALRIEVEGRQWWWRVHYRPRVEPLGAEAAATDPAASAWADRPVVPLANEIRLPVGERVELILTSPDVIHSFWIPPLGGKMDMIPGRVNRLVLEPTRTGRFRGACAEYCGASHAWMAFPVVVAERPEFDAWLAGQAAAAAEPASAAARRGRKLFSVHGCGACHTIRGTGADGLVGPDLTHVGSRLSLAAGTLPAEPADFRRWIAYTEAIKPEVHMPAFEILPDRDLDALAAYLAGLR